MQRKFLRNLLFISAFAFMIFATCALKSLNTQLSGINDDMLDLAITYDALAFNLAANLPGCG